MFENVRTWFRGVVNNMIGRTALQAAGLPLTAITDGMAEAIERWKALYSNQAPWLAKNKLTLALPSSIAQQIAMMVTLESQINVGNGEDDKGEELNDRAKLIKETFDKVRKELPIRTEYACALGGLVFKPTVYNGAVHVDYVNADNFYPVSFNAKGDITDAIFVEKKCEKDKWYLRVERHEVLPDNAYRITNKAFLSYNGKDFGAPIALTDVPEWSELEAETNLKSIETPLFSYFKIPQGNVINSDSMLGVSVYARAETSGAIAEADKQFQRLMWEYEGGELAIDASQDAFKFVKDRNGKALPVLPEGKERLYRVNSIDEARGGNGFFSTFSPALRDGNFVMGLNEVLMRIEDQCSLSRGTLSNVNMQARTATELKISHQRSYATISSIQIALQNALEQLGKAVDELATLYELSEAGSYTLTFVWDDSIITDADTERARDMMEVKEGLLQPWEYRVKWYGETEEQAKNRLQEAQMQSLQQMMQMQMNNGNSDEEPPEEQPKEQPEQTNV